MASRLTKPEPDNVAVKLLLRDRTGGVAPPSAGLAGDGEDVAAAGSFVMGTSAMEVFTTTTSSPLGTVSFSCIVVSKNHSVSSRNCGSVVMATTVAVYTALFAIASRWGLP